MNAVLLTTVMPKKLTTTQRARRTIRLSPRIRKYKTPIKFAAAAIAILGLLIIARPQFKEGTFAMRGQPPASFVPPLVFHTNTNADALVRFQMRSGVLRPRFYTVTADDCVDSITVNGVSVSHANIPFCDYATGRVLPLGDYLRPGDNTVEVILQNFGGEMRLDVQVAWDDPLLLFLILALFILCACLGISILRIRKASQTTYGLFGIVALGSMLRIVYFLKTPYWIRAHDVDGHIEYMRYFLNHFSLPPIGEGWEFYQPPLYYIFGSLVMRAGQAMGLTDTSSLRLVQGLSLIISIGTLLLIVWIARLLFAEKSQSKFVQLFALIGATLPGLIFFAPRINNDVLAAFFSFLTVALVLSWWKSRSMRTLVLLSIVVSLHLLTKNTGLVLIPFIGACILYQEKFSLRQKILQCILFLLLVTVMAGWHSVLRWTEDHEKSLIVGNASNLNGELRVSEDLASYVTFNPFEIVRHPYNNPWTDMERRQYLWEFLFRSAISGEFTLDLQHRELVQWILLGNLLILLLLVPLGIGSALIHSTRRALPLFILCTLLLLAHAYFRWKFPFSSSQDFRYSTLLTVPFAAYAIYATKQMTKHIQTAAIFLVQMTSVLEAMLILSL